MASILVPVIVILSILMIAIVLIQKSKGGGLAAGFQSSNQIMGAPKTADFLEKATWSLMGIIAVLCILCTIFPSGQQQAAKTIYTTEAAPATPENVETEAPAAEVPAEAAAE